MTPTITAYNWAPDEGRGLVRDMRVRWALEEVGQPYQARLLNWGEQKEPEHRARNPFGQVPAYEEGGLVLFESGAIVLHIAQGKPGILPHESEGRARAIGWMFAALNTVEPVVWDWVMASFVERDKDWSQARLPSVEARLHERLKELSAWLGGKDYLEGAFTAGDLLMIAVLRNLSRSPLLKPYANLVDYVARGEARPAFGRALADLRAGLIDEVPEQFRKPK
jgi:glutathione S-transferase